MIRKGNRIELRDEGVFKGIVRLIDLVGGGAAATVSGDTGTLTISCLPLAGGTMTGTLDLDGQLVILDAAGTTALQSQASGLASILYSDDSAGAGPYLRLARISASPAVSDPLGVIDFFGKDSAGNDQLYGQIYCVISDPTSTSEDGSFNINVMVNGTATNVANIVSTSVQLPQQTGSRACVFDANALITSSSVTATELGYLSGIASVAHHGFLLNTYTPSGAASVDITSQITSTYDRYAIWFDLRVATDNVTLYLRTDSSNGASFDSGATDYQYAGNTSLSNATSAAYGSGGATQILLTGSGIGNATNEGASGVIWLTFRGSASMYPQFVTDVAFADLSTNLKTSRGSGFRANAAAIDAVQILTSSGNLSGTVRIYGIPNS